MGKRTAARRGDADGDVALGWAPVPATDHAPRTVAELAFVATARGVVGNGMALDTHL